MLTTSTVSGYGTDGRIHEVRIARGLGDDRHIVCGTCGHRQTTRAFVRSKAEHHLVLHSARRGVRQRLSPAPWIVGLLGSAGFVAVFAFTTLGR